MAQTDSEWEECLRLHRFAESLNKDPSLASPSTVPTYYPPYDDAVLVPTRLLSSSEAQHIEPSILATSGVLESLSTGIIDSHALMTSLHSDFEDAGGLSVFHSLVTRIEPLDHGKSGYRIFVRDRGSAEESSIVSETLINAAGLSAVDISNMILPPERHRKAFFAKGTYFAYSPSSSSSSSPSSSSSSSSEKQKPSTSPRSTRLKTPTRLIYPVPRPGLGGLGTHLTLDLQGRMRFGPDVEWVDDPCDLTPRTTRLEEAVEEIRRYLPAVRRGDLTPDYCGIRPKLGKVGAVASSSSKDGDSDGDGDVKSEKSRKSSKKGFQDFVIQKEDGFEGFVNLLGIESPGLTSCLAIGEMVEGLLYE